MVVLSGANTPVYCLRDDPGQTGLDGEMVVGGYYFDILIGSTLCHYHEFPAVKVRIRIPKLYHGKKDGLIEQYPQFLLNMS
jgi:hypothetical protein